jgi:N6-adenosine-specific RNA methylase IME4
VDDLQELARQGKKFGTILADPPWSYSNQGRRGSTDDHYDTMTLDQIAALPVGELAADCCHLHLWTTNAFLTESLVRIIPAWGFEFQGAFIWVKPKIGLGNCWRVSHEYLLLAIKGDPRKFRARDLRSWGEFDRGEHSAKPPEVRNLIERASAGPFLELFGRRLIEGWTVWGNQVQKDVISWGGTTPAQAPEAAFCG